MVRGRRAWRGARGSHGASGPANPLARVHAKRRLVRDARLHQHDGDGRDSRVLANAVPGRLLSLRGSRHGSFPAHTGGSGRKLFCPGSDLQRNAQVRMGMVLTDASGESVSLYHEVHVNNTP